MLWNYAVGMPGALRCAEARRHWMLNMDVCMGQVCLGTGPVRMHGVLGGSLLEGGPSAGLRAISKVQCSSELAYLARRLIQERNCRPYQAVTVQLPLHALMREASAIKKQLHSAPHPCGRGC